jgi:hypothetical protein
MTITVGVDGPAQHQAPQIDGVLSALKDRF